MKKLKTILLFALPLALLLAACTPSAAPTDTPTQTPDDNATQAPDDNGGDDNTSAFNKPEDLPAGDSALQIQSVVSENGTVSLSALSGVYNEPDGFAASGATTFRFALGSDFVGYLWEPEVVGASSRDTYNGPNGFFNYYQEAVNRGVFSDLACTYSFNDNGELNQLYECVDLSGVNSAPEIEVTFFYDFSFGSANENCTTEVIAIPESEFDEATLIRHLNEETGLAFDCTVSYEGDRYIVNWLSDSSLITGQPADVQKEEYTFLEADSLRWFMMDSLSRTLKHNMGEEEIYFTVNNGDDLVLEEMYPNELFPADVPYMGSSFYFAHASDE